MLRKLAFAVPLAGIAALCVPGLFHTARAAPSTPAPAIGAPLVETVRDRGGWGGGGGVVFRGGGGGGGGIRSGFSGGSFRSGFSGGSFRGMESRGMRTGDFRSGGFSGRPVFRGAAGPGPGVRYLGDRGAGGSWRGYRVEAPGKSARFYGEGRRRITHWDGDYRKKPPRWHDGDGSKPGQWNDWRRKKWGHWDGHHGKKKHRHRRYLTAFYFGPSYYYDDVGYSYGYDEENCAWLKEQALENASTYWWKRYRACKAAEAYGR